MWVQSKNQKKSESAHSIETWNTKELSESAKKQS